MGIEQWMRTRREFIRDAALATAGVVVASFTSGCDKIPGTLPLTENPTSKHFKDLLEYKDEMTSAELAQLLHEKTFKDNGTWMTNAPLGFKRQYYGNLTDAKTDKLGEENTPDVSVKFIYPEPRANVPSKKELIFGNNSIIIYGTSATVGRLLRNEDILKKFTEEYFRGTRAEKNYLVLNFLPITKDLEIPELDLNVKSKGQPNAMTVTHIKPNKGQPDILDYRVVVFNLNKMHAASEMIGETPQNDVIESIGNEKANFIADDLILNDTNQPVSEAPSTIAGLLAVNDPVFAAKLIGGTAYLDFSKIIATEMEQLKGISNKFMAFLSRRDLLQGKIPKAYSYPQFTGRRLLHTKQYAIQTPTGLLPVAV